MATIKVKCLTDSISCPCIDVKKCIIVSTNGPATKEHCITDAPCATNNTECCEKVSLDILPQTLVDVEYCVQVSNTEPIKRFFVGSLEFVNTTASAINVFEVGLADGTNQLAPGVLSGSLPIVVPPAGKLHVPIQGSFDAPNGIPIIAKPYYKTSAGGDPIVVSGEVSLDALFACDVEEWTVSDELKRDGSVDLIPVTITPSQLTFTITDIIGAPNQTIVYIVKPEELLTNAEQPLGTPVSTTFTNIFTVQPALLGAPPIQSNSAILTLNPIPPTITVTPSVDCPGLEQWCLCKTDTLIPATEVCPALIAYTMTVTKTNDSEDCCTKVEIAATLGENVPISDDFQLSYELQKKTGEQEWTTLGTRSPLTFDDGKYVATLDCVDGLESGNTIRVCVYYPQQKHILATNVTQNVDPQVIIEYCGVEVAIPQPTTKPSAFLTDTVTTNCIPPDNVLNPITSAENNVNSCFSPLFAEETKAQIIFSGNDQEIETIELDNDPNSDYAVFLNALRSLSGINLAETGDDEFVPDGTDSIDITYYVEVPPCACKVKNVAAVVSTSGDRKKVTTSEGETETIIKPCDELTPVPQSRSSVKTQTNTPVKTIVSAPSRTHDPIIVAEPEIVVSPQISSSKPIVRASKPTVVAKVTSPQASSSSTTPKAGCASCAAAAKKRAEAQALKK